MGRDLIVVVYLGISTLMIVLGFIALLTQRIYFDKETQKPIEMTLPLLGKVKTNYPALIFVFLGFTLCGMAFNKAFPPPMENWKITGQLVCKNNVPIDFREGVVTLFPTDFKVDIGNNGRFEIEGEIEKGKHFHEVIQFIDYTHEMGNIKLFPEEEIQAYRTDRQNSLIEKITANTIHFGDCQIKMARGVQ